MSNSKLRVLNGALDDFNGNIVLRGVIDSNSFDCIKVGPYQREEASESHIASLVAALESGARFPDVEIGIRGNNYNERSGVFIIDHPSFIVDGFQRLTASRRYLERHPEKAVHLGALLHFGTSERWERDRFRTLNTKRSRVSASVLLRNEVDSSAVKSLYSMTVNDKQFVLHKRINWNQNMARGDIANAVTIMKALGDLFSHFGPSAPSNVQRMVQIMDKTHGILGENIWRSNVRTFFDLLDQAFGIRSIAYRDSCPHVTGCFMSTLGRMLADHETFWDGKHLLIQPYDIQKLKTFPIFDPSVKQIVCSASRVTPLLYSQLVEHMNRGRRTRRMKKWNGQVADGIPFSCIEAEGSEE